MKPKWLMNENITKAQRIVGELIATLDMEQGGEVAKNLVALYTYVYEKLVEANLEDKPELVQECATIVSELRESWVELERQSRNTAIVEEQDRAA